MNNLNIRKTLLFLFLSFFAQTIISCAGIVDEVNNKRTLIYIEVEDTKMYLLGTLNEKSYVQISNTIEENPQIDTIILTAIDGTIDDESTLDLGWYVRKRGINMHLLGSSVIASGGVDLFLAGVERTMERGAHLGVHAWSDNKTEATDYERSDEIHENYIQYMHAMLGSEKFYWFTIYAAKAEDIHWMSEEEIEDYGLLTSSIITPQEEMTLENSTPFGEFYVDHREWILEE